MIYDSEEEILIRTAQNGDLGAFNGLIDRYQGFLFRIAYRMLGDEDAAADAAQAAWLAAFRKLSEHRGGRFRAWLTRILINSCYDELRRRHRRGEVSLYPADDDGEEREDADWLLDRSPGVEARVEMRQMEQAVERALQFLPPVYRTTVVLVDIEGLGYEQAAEALGVPLGTIRSRVARGRIALRQHLEESGYLAHDWQYDAVPTPERSHVRCL
jgi:RNA polymerase sigma-70 factor (ECF subfamily)